MVVVPYQFVLYHHAPIAGAIGLLGKRFEERGGSLSATVSAAVCREGGAPGGRKTKRGMLGSAGTAQDGQGKHSDRSRFSHICDQDQDPGIDEEDEDAVGHRARGCLRNSGKDWEAVRLCSHVPSAICLEQLRTGVRGSGRTLRRLCMSVCFSS